MTTVTDTLEGQSALEAGAQDDVALSVTSYERVHAAMLRDIINGAIQPGDRLKTAELALRYKVSQMPIREAIQRLQGEGLVTLTPNYGARVRSFDTKFIADLYALRCELHVFAHQDIYIHWDAALPGLLTSVQERYDVALAAGDAAACQIANIEFHALMNNRCTNAEVVRVLASQERLVRTLRSALGYSRDRLTQQAHEHWLLIHAIARRDMVGGMAVVRSHVMNAAADVIALYESRSAHPPARALPVDGHSR